MAADFSGVRAKLSRAEKHLDDFETELRAYLESEPVSLAPKSDDDPTRQDFYVVVHHATPANLDLILGDCLHNLRSALDHIVHALAIDNGHSGDGRMTFPICSAERYFYGQVVGGGRPGQPLKRTGWHKIRELSQLAQAFIEGLQPYHGGDRQLISDLQTLDNLDKHSSLIRNYLQPLATYAAPQGVTIDYASRLRLEHKAYFATVNYSTGYQGVKVQPQVTAAICIDRIGTPGFRDAREFVRDELLPFVRDDIIGEAESRFS